MTTTPDHAPELDERFSDTDATPVPWDETRQVLETSELSWVTTVRADGRPHVTPLVTVWLDDVVHFCTGSEEQKAHNLADNPHVVVTTGCNTWDAGLDVMVEGEATARHRPHRGSNDSRSPGAEVGRTVDLHRRRRWLRPRRCGRRPHRRTGARVRGARRQSPSFGKGTFSQTRYV